MECLYMQSNVRFKEEVSRVCTDIFSSDEAGNILITGKNLMFTKFTMEEINQHIIDLQAYAKNNKLHLSGAFVIAKYETGIEFKCIQVSNTTAKEADVSAKITTSKTEKAKKKQSLNQDQKLALIKAYYHENESFPTSSTVYKGVKIGTFWTNLEKNKNTYERVKKELE